MLPGLQTPKEHPVYVVLVERRLKDDAPDLELYETETKVRSVLAPMGFAEYVDYLLVRHDRVVDIKSASADVLA